MRHATPATCCKGLFTCSPEVESHAVQHDEHDFRVRSQEARQLSQSGHLSGMVMHSEHMHSVREERHCDAGCSLRPLRPLLLHVAVHAAEVLHEHLGHALQAHRFEAALGVNIHSLPHSYACAQTVNEKHSVEAT